MKRKLLLLTLVLATAMPVFAQRIVESSEEFVTYDRNSVSVIVTKHNDSYDEVLLNTAGDFNFGSKFDVNKIDTKVVRVSQSRNTPEGQASGWAYSPDEATINEVLSQLNNANVGKEILTYILNPDANGRFNREIINKRGQWNASEKDYIESKATQVDAMGQDGEKLIDNSYIIVFDLKNPEKVETVLKDKNGKNLVITTWKGDVGAMVFQIQNAKELVMEIVSNLWIYEADPVATQEAKRQAFQNMKVKMELVASAGTHCNGNELRNVIANAKSKLIQKLEDKIPAWQVTIDCETVEPYITAKIGKKEGVRNGQRYGIYGQVYNSSKDRLEFKRKGYVRATEVADNRRVADGTSDSTYFYRISGTPELTGTEILKQRNDLGLGISFNYNLNGSTSEPAKSRTFGSFSMMDITLDYLAFINKKGFSHYVLVGLGLDKYSGENIAKGLTTIGTYKEVYDDEHNPVFGESKGASYTNVFIGYMFGIKIKQFAEIQPFLRGGIDMISTSTDIKDDNLKLMAAEEEYTIKSENDLSKSTTGYYLDPGLRVAVNVIYPVQIYLQANYSILLTAGDKYNIINKYLQNCGYGHTNGLGVGGGVRVMF